MLTSMAVSVSSGLVRSEGTSAALSEQAGVGLPKKAARVHLTIHAGGQEERGRQTCRYGKRRPAGAARGAR